MFGIDNIQVYINEYEGIINKPCSKWGSTEIMGLAMFIEKQKDQI